jgi:hypothetical protein
MPAGAATKRPAPARGAAGRAARNALAGFPRSALCEALGLQ